MATGIPYKTAQLEDLWDAIVIGSGMGGLTTAVMLAKHAGKRVLVLERHYTAGGFTHTFHRPGFEWDVGLHYVGQMRQGEAVRKAFDHLTGGAVKWQPMPEVYDRVCVEDGAGPDGGSRRFDYVAGPKHMRQQLVEWFPTEAKAIDRYLELVKGAGQLSLYFYAEKALPVAWKPLIGGMLRRSYLRFAKKTTAQVLKKLKASPELAGVLTAQWGDYGLPPAESSFAIHATIVGHYLRGAAYPVGGAGAIAAAMAPIIESTGGKVVAAAEVEQILLRGRRAIGVKMTDGREFRAPIIFSDAGAITTFERLLPQNLSATRKLRKKLAAIGPSTAHVSLYVGLNASDAELGMDPANLWVFPSLDHDANMARFAADVDAPLPLTYLSFPSAKDPDFARRHPGKSTVEVITLVPYEWFAKWESSRWHHREEEYEALKAKLTQRLLETLERHVPAVRGKIEHAELSTPLTTRHFANHAHGEIYGLSSRPERYKLRELEARTPVKGLYLTGQDVVSLGVAGALFGGVISASVALHKNLMRKFGEKK